MTENENIQPPASPEGPNGTAVIQKGFGSKLLNAMSSIRTAITLLTLIAAACVLGTFVPQGRDFIFYKKNFPGWLDYIYAFSIDDLYHSWWFVTLLAALCLNVAVCTLRRAAARLRRKNSETAPVDGSFITSLPASISAGRETRQEAEEALLKLRAALVAAGYSANDAAREGGRIFAQRGKYCFIGEAAIHLSILLILAGGMIGNAYGYKSYIQGFPGETLPVRTREVVRLEARLERAMAKMHASGANTGRAAGDEERLEIASMMTSMKKLSTETWFRVRIDDFATELYPAASDSPEAAAAPTVKNWYTTLTLIEKGRAAVTKRISVNDPLEYKGVYIYQSSWGVDTGFGSDFAVSAVRRGSTAETMINLRNIGYEAELSGEGVFVKAVRFEPDFRVDVNTGSIYSESGELVNPALCVEIREARSGTSEARLLWLFKNMPDFSRSRAEAAGLSHLYELKSFGTMPREYTGLTVAYDPGAVLVWIGSFLMVAGLFWNFNASTKRVWALAGEGGKVFAGGTASRDIQGFRREFDSILKAAGLRDGGGGGDVAR